MASSSNNENAEALLGVDDLSLILGFLDWKTILKARVSKKWQDAAVLTDVPRSNISGWGERDFLVTDRNRANALSWLSVALPRMDTIEIDFSLGITKSFDIVPGIGHSSSHLRLDPELAADMTIMDPIDISVLRGFHSLRNLRISSTQKLNGSYPFLFQFQNLVSLNLTWETNLVWDMSMLVGLQRLERLRASQNHLLTGTLQSARVLKNTLVELCLHGCCNVTGNIKDLADFPNLEEVYLDKTKVSGDIREIGTGDFLSLKRFEVGDLVYGGGDIMRTEDASPVMEAKYRLKKRNPELFSSRRWRLSEESPQFYRTDGRLHHSREPPLWVEFVTAGPRIGWRWTNAVSGGSCETNWLEPPLSPPPPEEEGSSNDDYSGYEKYLHELNQIENKDVELFKGYTKKPPTQEEHARCCQEIPLDPVLQMFANNRQFGGWW